MNQTALIKLDKARLLLIEAKTIQDVGVVLNIAKAAEIYARAAKLGEEAIGHAHEIKILSLAKLGNMLMETDRNKGGRPPKTSPSHGLVSTQTLKDLSLTKNESSIAQNLAALPPNVVERISKREISLTATLNQNRLQAEANNRKPLPEGIYNLIYADPPWSYVNSGFSGGANAHYSTMTTNDICKLGVKEIAHENCALFLWATNPMLLDGLTVLQQWGFVYKTNYVWIKNKSYAGFHTKGQHELLLVGERGSLKPRRIVSSVLEFPVTKHSQKPKEVYEIIEDLYPNCSRLELFARNKRDGWASWGNEV